MIVITGRYGQPEEVAGLIEFLALHPAASYITGQVCGFSTPLFKSNMFPAYNHAAQVLPLFSFVLSTLCFERSFLFYPPFLDALFCYT